LKILALLYGLKRHASIPPVLSLELRRLWLSSEWFQWRFGGFCWALDRHSTVQRIRGFLKRCALYKFTFYLLTYLQLQNKCCGSETGGCCCIYARQTFCFHSPGRSTFL